MGNSDSTGVTIPITLDALIAWQSRADGVFACETCRNYRGKLQCTQNIFIAFVGANMSDCALYKEERREARLAHE